MSLPPHSSQRPHGLLRGGAMSYVLPAYQLPTTCTKSQAKEWVTNDKVIGDRLVEWSDEDVYKF